MTQVGPYSVLLVLKDNKNQHELKTAVMGAVSSDFFVDMKLVRVMSMVKINVMSTVRVMSKPNIKVMFKVSPMEILKSKARWI